MSGSRPWWASEGPVDGGVDPAEDPLLAHRTARWGGREPDPEVDPDEPGGSGPDEDGDAGHAPPGSASGHAPPGSEICGVCPVCIAARMLGETRPELLAHLTEAGRHLSAALSALLETRTDRSGHGQDPPPDARRVRRIDLD